jgi:hypothetical protein
LAAVMEADPAACGWDEDQRRTLARVAEVIRTSEDQVRLAEQNLAASSGV